MSDEKFHLSFYDLTHEQFDVVTKNQQLLSSKLMRRMPLKSRVAPGWLYVLLVFAMSAMFGIFSEFVIAAGKSSGNVEEGFAIVLAQKVNTLVIVSVMIFLPFFLGIISIKSMYKKIMRGFFKEKWRESTHYCWKTAKFDRDGVTLDRDGAKSIRSWKNFDNIICDSGVIIFAFQSDIIFSFSDVALGEEKAKFLDFCRMNLDFNRQFL